MSSPFELLQQSLGGDAVSQLSRSLGADSAATHRAVSAAVPMLMTALAGNASRSGGADALLGALDRDHDGSVLDDLGGFLGNSGAAVGAGDGILRHVLGGRRATAEGQLAQASGLDAASAGKLLAMLAPLVLGALGKSRRSGGLDSGGLADLLGQEQRRARQSMPSGMGGLLGGLLDADGDGEVMDDALKMGGKMLGSLFKR
ncbi:MAG: DUF937 domain-containing protein [Acidobacteriota bacterium]